MAEDSINITVTGMEKIEEVFAQLATKIATLKQPLGAIGSYLTNIIEESFDAETSPSGEAWHPLAESTKKYKARHGGSKILQSGNRTLRESIGYEVMGEEGVIVGVNAYSSKGYPYPIAHQFGTEDGKIKARPFMPITQDGELYDNVNEEVLDILLGYLAE